MIGLLQRVCRASVAVTGEVVGSIDAGLVVLLGFQPEDSVATAEKLLNRLLNYRVFADAEGKMNLSLKDHGGGLLLVPQFTLCADTRRGMRPGFSTAASPELAVRLFGYLVERAAQVHSPVAAGRFGAHMQLSLINDGPVTFWLSEGQGYGHS